MKQNIEARQAEPLSDATKILAELYESTTNHRDQVASHIVSNIEKLSNPDTCITKAQQRHLEYLINQSARLVVEGESVDVHSTQIITFINSIRLECLNCLNKECANRDPKA